MNDKIGRISLYGFGRYAKSNIDFLINNFNIGVIIDNSDKLPLFYHKIPIINFVDYLKSKYANDKIIVLATGKALLSIKETLKKNKKQENEDFWELDVFIREIYSRSIGQLGIDKVIVSLTTKCTFNCKNCNMFLPYLKKKMNFPLEQLKKDLDVFFSIIDFVMCLVLQGGEIFLHPHVEEYLLYLMKNYRDRVKNVQIITNGSLIPSKEILSIIKEYNIEVRISDYTHIINYKKKMLELIDTLEEYKIKYIVFKQTDWVDLGFPEEKVCISDTKEKIREHMLKCHSMCHLLHNGKYYYCGCAWAASEGQLFELSEGDYLELSELEKNVETGKERIKEFNKGNLQGGYLSFCNVCRGFCSEKCIVGGVQF